MNRTFSEDSFSDILGWIEDEVDGITTQNPLSFPSKTSSEENSDEFLGWEGDEAEWLTTSPPDADHIGAKFESIISGEDIDIGITFRYLFYVYE